MTMEDRLKEIIWKQFGASIDMLKNALTLCPEELFNSNKKFFYISYHTLLFLDYYLTIPPTGFSSPLPYTHQEPGEVPEDAVDDMVPARFYSKLELLAYLASTRKKCQALTTGLTEKKLLEPWMLAPDQIAGRSTMNFSILEILFYGLRHVQHHVGQLNLLLRQQLNTAPGWVGSAND